MPNTMARVLDVPLANKSFSSSDCMLPDIVPKTWYRPVPDSTLIITTDRNCS